MIFRSETYSLIIKIYKFVCLFCDTVSNTELASNSKKTCKWRTGKKLGERRGRLNEVLFLFRFGQLIMGHGLFILEASRSHSDSRRLLPDNIQHSKETDIHATDGIRTCNPSMRTSADPCLRLRDQWALLLRH